MRGESTDMNKRKEIQNIRQLFLKWERDFPCSLVVKTALPTQGCRFDPWSGNSDPACSVAKKRRKEENKETINFETNKKLQKKL